MPAFDVQSFDISISGQRIGGVGTVTRGIEIRGAGGPFAGIGPRASLVFGPAFGPTGPIVGFLSVGPRGRAPALIGWFHESRFSDCLELLRDARGLRVEYAFRDPVARAGYLSRLELVGAGAVAAANGRAVAAPPASTGTTRLAALHTAGLR